MNTKKEIIEIVIEGLVQILNVNKTNVQLNSHLRDDLGLDSLSSMEFLVYLEDEIEGFVVNPETIEARSFNTVETISDYAHSEIAQTLLT